MVRTSSQAASSSGVSMYLAAKSASSPSFMPTLASARLRRSCNSEAVKCSIVTGMPTPFLMPRLSSDTHYALEGHPRPAMNPGTNIASELHTCPHRHIHNTEPGPPETRARPQCLREAEGSRSAPHQAPRRQAHCSDSHAFDGGARCGDRRVDRAQRQHAPAAAVRPQPG